MSLTPEEAVGTVLAALDADRIAGPVVVAVSGGGDSMALLHATVLAARHRRVLAVTLDHGLRPGSAAEADAVARACASLGVPHETIRWDGAGRGNLQARAREARRRLIGSWAKERGASAVLLGHTADDQAETVVLRLARGSGVDGLSGMPRFFVAEGVGWDRPFLDIPREALRSWLASRGISWLEDPSNEDVRFDRVRARSIMERLAQLGLTRERLVRTAGHMARARSALVSHARETASRIVKEDGRDLLIPLHLLRSFDQGDEPGRILSAALQWVGGRQQRPRWESLRRLAQVVSAGRPATLGGCRVVPEGDWARLTPEARNSSVLLRDAGLRFSGNADFQ